MTYQQHSMRLQFSSGTKIICLELLKGLSVVNYHPEMGEAPSILKVLLAIHMCELVKLSSQN